MSERTLLIEKSLSSEKPKETFIGSIKSWFCHKNKQPSQQLDPTLIKKFIDKKNLSLELLPTLSHSDMLSIILEKNGLIYHKSNHTCLICECECWAHEQFIPITIVSASCCQKENCKKLTELLLRGGYRMIGITEPDIDVTVQRSNGVIENNWKVIYLDVDVMHVVVCTQNKTLGKPVRIEDFNRLNPKVIFDLRFAPYDVSEVVRRFIEKMPLTFNSKIFLFE